MAWAIQQQVAHLQKLLAPDILGNYSSFEVTEFVGFKPNEPATNLFTLMVAEPLAPVPTPAKGANFISGKPKRLRSTDWQVGVARSRLSLQQVLSALGHLQTTGEWKPDKNPLRVGRMQPALPQFVPSHSSVQHPWNGVLKNNFFEGSHLVEICDVAKPHVQFLIDEPRLLSELAAILQPYSGIAIDGLSDRLGNIVIQLPVTVISTAMRGSRDGAITMEPVWRRGAPQRPLQVSFERYYDGTVDEFASKTVQAGPTTFPLHSPGGGPRYVVWDAANEVVLGASAPTSFITRIYVGMNDGGEPSEKSREFVVLSEDGTEHIGQVQLLKHSTMSPVSDELSSDPREPWRSKRVFGESLERLERLKEFVQYGTRTGDHDSRALADVRWLIDEHGKDGVWLWDPFLDAKDVLSTLFYCKHRGADLRALTAGQEVRESKGPTPNKAVARLRAASKWAERRLTTGRLGAWLNGNLPVKTWSQYESDDLERCKGNCEGLQLEFRIRQGVGAWPFHDRFLIFPGGAPGQSKAWSLGTSVNSLGRQHHILQKVSDGERIAQAFLELWNELARPENLVWKTP